MKTLSTLIIGAAILSGAKAHAITCIAIDGQKKLSAYWGHGQAWVNVSANSTEFSFTGGLQNIGINSQLFVFIIDSPASHSKLTILNFGNPTKPETWQKTGLLNVEGREEFFNCK